MDLAHLRFTVEEEQKVIVKFLVLRNNRNHKKIHQQLTAVYGANTVSLEQVLIWFNCFIGVERRTVVKPPAKKRVTTNKVAKAEFSCLHTTEHPWRPLANCSETNEEPNTDLVSRKLLGILNKITEINYDVLLEQLKSLPINTEDCLRKAVKIILFYVRTEHKFTKLYARMCLDLSRKYVPYEKQIIGACPMYLTFSELIRDGCKEELTQMLKESESLEFLNDFKARFNLKGITLFISNLYNTLALPVEIVLDEYLKLLFDNADSRVENNLFRIECCYECLNSLGKFLDLESSNDAPKIEKETVDLYFKILSDLTEGDNNLPIFLRYKIKELIEMRAKNWVPRIIQEEEFITKEQNDVPFNKSTSGGRTKNFRHRHFRRPRKVVNKDEELEKKLSQLFLAEIEDMRKANIPEEEKIMRKVRQCLNKMTVDNFTKIANRILTLPLETVIEKVATLIVKKATVEPLFNSLYAELCFQLTKKTWKQRSDNDEKKNSEEDDNGENKLSLNSVPFKELLIGECKNLWYSKLDENADERSHYKWQTVSTGVAKFISELYWLGIINMDIINSFVESLLFNESKLTPLNIELFCVLLKYNGSYLEKDHKDGVDNYFQSIKQLYEKLTPSISVRLRYMLLNLMELRERNWTPRVSDDIIKPGIKNIIADDNNKQPDKNRRSYTKKYSPRKPFKSSRQRSRQKTHQHRQSTSSAGGDKIDEKNAGGGQSSSVG